MSAAIVQKNNNNTATTYFECGDIFNTKKSADKDRVNTSPMIQEIINVATLDNDGHIVSMYKQKEKLERNNNHNRQHHPLSRQHQNQTTSSPQHNHHNQNNNNNNNNISNNTGSQNNSSKENDQYNFHNALTRTISQPQPQPQRDPNTTTTLVNNLIENFGTLNLHRKLERTQSEPLPQQVNTSRYKTELCRPFEEAGECKYGEKCQFAHGYHELRNLQRHPKYKTEYCRTFHSVGFCPYGMRCHFVHNADEAQQQQQQQQQQHTKLQNHSGNSFNNCISQYPVANTGIKQVGAGIGNGVGGGIGFSSINQTLPLSPPLSMSTGSDRESPTGSLSMSPTTSMTNFPFSDQISPANSVFPSAFSYVNTPPESPNEPISPVNTPPPTLSVLGGSNLNNIQQQQQIYIKPMTIQGKQVLQKSSSSPIAAFRNASKTPPTKVNSTSSLNGDDARLPVFNRLSSAFDNYPNIVI